MSFKQQVKELIAEVQGMETVTNEDWDFEMQASIDTIRAVQWLNLCEAN